MSLRQQRAWKYVLVKQSDTTITHSLFFTGVDEEETRQKTQIFTLASLLLWLERYLRPTGCLWDDEACATHIISALSLTLLLACC